MVTQFGPNLKMKQYKWMLGAVINSNINSSQSHYALSFMATHGSQWYIIYSLLLNRFQNIFVIPLNQQGCGCYSCLPVHFWVWRKEGWAIIIITEEEQWCIYRECCSLFILPRSPSWDMTWTLPGCNGIILKGVWVYTWMQAAELSLCVFS